MERETIMLFLSQLSPETIAVIEADVERIASEATKEALIKERTALEALKAGGIDKKIASLTTQISAIDIIK